MTIMSVLENVIANLIAIAFLGTTAYLLIYLRMSGLSKIFRRFIHPQKRVIALHQLELSHVEKQMQSDFVSPISERDRDILVKFYVFRNRVKLFNGISIRLDRLEFTDNEKKQAIAHVSKVGFFDFISTNLTAFPSNESVHSLRKQLLSIFRSIRTFGIIQQVTSEVQKNGHMTSVTQVLENRSLANIIAVSVLMIDANGKAGVVQRTKRVAVSSGHFGSTCAGTVSEIDFSEDDPFISCAIREIKEELNIDIKSLHFDGIVIPKQKMQPIILYHSHISQSWEELFPQIQQARDISFETQAFFAVPVDRLIPFASHVQMTDTAAYQIWRYAQHNGHKQGWIPSLFKPLRFNQYLLPWQKCCNYPAEVNRTTKVQTAPSDSKDISS